MPPSADDQDNQATACKISAQVNMAVRNKLIVAREAISRIETYMVEFLIKLLILCLATNSLYVFSMFFICSLFP